VLFVLERRRIEELSAELLHAFQLPQHIYRLGQVLLDPREQNAVEASVIDRDPGLVADIGEVG